MPGVRYKSVSTLLQTREASKCEGEQRRVDIRENNAYRERASVLGISSDMGVFEVQRRDKNRSAESLQVAKNQEFISFAEAKEGQEETQSFQTASKSAETVLGVRLRRSL